MAHCHLEKKMESDITPDITPDVTVDARGMMGALPVLQASRELKHMKPGEVMLLLADNDSVVDDVRELEGQGACELLSHERDDDGLKVYIKKI